MAKQKPFFESDAAFRALLEHAQDEIVITDSDGYYEYVSPSVLHASKYDSKIFVGENRFDFVHPDDVDDLKELYQKVLKKSGNHSISRHRFLLADGSVQMLEASVSSILDQEGEIKVLLNVRDITDRYEAMCQLKESEAKVQEHLRELEAAHNELAEEVAHVEAILSAIGEGLIVTDAQAEVILLNPTSEDLFGMKMQDLVGKKLTDVIDLIDDSGSPIPESDRPFSKILSNRETLHSLKCRIRLKTGRSMILHVTGSPILLNRELLGVVFVFRDITEEEKIDQAKTEFVTFASHQLRTPLTAIGGYTDMLLSEDSGSLSSDQRIYLEKISRNNARLVDLVDTLLNLSNIELGTVVLKPQEVRLQRSLKSVAREVEIANHSEDSTFDISCSKDLPILYHDRKYLRIILQNLLSNALKYSSETVQVSVSLTKEDSVLIKVVDSGCGIPEPQQKRVFSKLFRADNVLKQDIRGNGLGLYIVKSVVDAMGGKIWFESEEGEGTTFFVQLPVRCNRSE